MIHPNWATRREREMLDRYSFRIVTPPAEEPVTLLDARLQLQLTATGEPASHPLDPWIESIGLPVARAMCEDYTGRSLVTQTIELAINGFPATCPGRWFDDGSLPLPRAPIRSIESVTYVDADGVTQTVDTANYLLDGFAEPAALYAAYGVAWPVAQTSRGAVRVRYVAGYSGPGESPQDFPLPPAIRGAVLLMLGHLNENREATSDLRFLADLPLGVTALLDPYRINWSVA
jgi:uncharacterized phiE125 gp8 family phage protein